jgi:hypothetical protein
MKRPYRDQAETYPNPDSPQRHSECMLKIKRSQVPYVQLPSLRVLGMKYVQIDWDAVAKSKGISILQKRKYAVLEDIEERPRKRRFLK